ncbi:unnamed protein product [Alopecurus aequalis]
MASRQVSLLAAAAITVAFLSAPASAMVYMVGDDAGWTLNYPATWTNDKTFRVGDTLMFMYPSGSHTVVEVGSEDFMACNVGHPVNSWSSGSDSVTLDKAGSRWFVCSVAEHCAQGMKLTIGVVG